MAYRATLDVPRALARHLARLLLTDQRERGTRRGRRALGVFSHAVLVLRWFREGTPVARPACHAGIGISTAYRYRGEHRTIILRRRAAALRPCGELGDQRFGQSPQLVGHQTL
jgi:hypothetical protein